MSTTDLKQHRFQSCTHDEQTINYVMCSNKGHEK